MKLKPLEIKAIAFMMSLLGLVLHVSIEKMRLWPTLFELNLIESLLATLVLFGGYFIFKDILMEGYRHDR